MPTSLANRYEVLSTLGEGGMGTVLLAKDTVSDREVAVKLLRAEGQAHLEQMRREFWMMTRLRHPRVVEVYDFGQLDDGAPYLTMEVVPGQSLDEVGPRSPDELRRILIDLAEALAYIHSQGLVHADIKPENIRQLPDGNLKLMDFGLMERSGQSGGPIRGTLLYLAPELARGGRIDARTDLYALGAVAYHLLTGDPPFVRPDPIALIKAHLNDPVPALGEDVPSDLAQTITRMLAKSPTERFSSAAELLSALGQETVGTATLLAPGFVGREAELEALDQGKVIRLEAPAGMGKSRLIQEYRFRAQLNGCAVLIARCLPDQGPYAVITELIRQILPLARSFALESLDTHAPILARLLPMDVEPAPGLEPQQERLRIQEALFCLLAKISQRQPLVLCVEDALGLDTASHETLDYLIRNLNSASVRVIVSGSRELPFDAPTLELPMLTASEIAALVASMVGHNSLPAEFLDALYRLSGGNPRHVDEFMQLFVADGTLVFEGHWKASKVPEPTHVPDGMRGLLVRKYEALSPEASRVVHALAVAGSGLSLGVLNRLSGLPKEDALYESLAELEGHDVVISQDGGFCFADRLWIPLVLETLGESERARWHRHLADALQADLESHPEDLTLLNAVAAHWLASDTPEADLQTVLKAGRRNLALFASEEAATLLSRGLELAKADMRLDFLSSLGDVYRLRGETERALEALTEAASLADDARRPRILTSLGKAYQIAARYGEAQDCLERAIAAADLVADKIERVRAMTTLARLHYFRGEPARTAELFEAGLQLSVEAGARVFQAECMAFLGFLHVSSPEYRDQGFTLLQQSLELKQEIGDKIGLNDTTMLLGNAYLALGRYQEARDCFVQCRKLNFEIGQRDEEVFSFLNLSIVALEMGNFREAERLAEQALAGSELTQSRYAGGMAIAMKGMARLYLGTLGEADQLLSQALGIARQTNNRYLESLVAVYRTEMLVVTGRLDEALSSGRELLDSLVAADNTELVPVQEATLGLALVLSGDREAGRSHLRTAFNQSTETDARGTLAKALYGLALLDARSRELSSAQRLAHEGLRIAEELGADHLSGLFHHLLGLLHLRQDRRSLATDHLRKALHLAEELGTPILHGRVLMVLSEADPLRVSDYRKLASTEGDRLIGTLPEAMRADFRTFWLTPLLEPESKASVQPLTLEAHLGRLQQDLDEFASRMRDQATQVEELALSQRRMEQLIDFSMRVHQIHDIPLVTEMALDLIITIAGANRGLLQLYRDGQASAEQVRNFPNEDRYSAEWRAASSLLSEVVRNDQPMCLTDASTDPRFEETDVSSAIGLPIKVRHVCIGALYIDRTSEPFGAKDLDLVLMLASLTANALENATMQAEALDKSRKLEMLNELSRTLSTSLVMVEVLGLVVKLTLEITKAERAYVLLWENESLECGAALDQAGNHLNLLESPISQTICDRVLSTGQSLCVADALQDGELQVKASIMALNLRTVMCVPLLYKQKVLGLLYVDSQAIVHHFTAKDLDLLEALASHAAVALMNAHFFSQLQHRAEQLEEMVKRYEEANLRASTDALTGIHNRRFIQESLTRDFAQARRYRRNLSVIMLDIDHFKSFNDTYGHALGDAVLKAVGQVVQQAVRLADVVARYGGEEFIVALPDTDLAGAVIVAERIRQSVSEIELTDPNDNPLRQITASLGVATLQPGDERIAELIERADRALYRAKVSGRDQVQTMED